jgi:hypothetical protein
MFTSQLWVFSLARHVLSIAVHCSPSLVRLT